MCRQLLHLFVGFVLIAIAFPGLLLTVLSVQLLNPNFYQSTLERSGLYEAMPDMIAEVAAREFAAQLAQQNQLPLADELFFSNAIQQVTPVLLDGMFIQDIVDQNIDNIFGYLREGEEELMIYIPKQDLRERMDTALDIVFNDLIPDAIAGLPTCSEAELMELADAEDFSQLTCVPEFVDEEQLNLSNLSKEVRPDIDSALTQYLAGPDDVSILELAGKQATLDFVSNLEYAQLAVQTYETSLMMLWLVIGLVALVFILLSKGRWVNKIRSLFLPVAVVGVLMAIVGITIKFMGGATVLGVTNTVNDDPNISVAMGESIIQVINTLIDAISDPIVIIGIALTALGLSLFFGLRYLDRSVDRVKR